jgi:hypothetical protein
MWTGRERDSCVGCWFRIVKKNTYHQRINNSYQSSGHYPEKNQRLHWLNVVRPVRDVLHRGLPTPEQASRSVAADAVEAVQCGVGAVPVPPGPKAFD